ncbi:MAG TPA: histidine kinase [Marinilabiliaceae bacterium]|nr:histidine kinase [Marinilabiliaceae bacterium]
MKFEHPDEFLTIHEPILRNTIKATIKRIFLVSFVGILAMFILSEILDLNNIYPKTRSLILSVLGINLLSEGNIIINRLLDKKKPWFDNLKKRVSIQLIFSFIWLVTITTLFAFLTPDSHSRDFTFAFIFGSFFIIVFNSVLFLRSFAFNWRQSLIKNEQLQRDKLHADYMVLQNQLNPHFLFNSFSVLISEIKYNPDNAIEFALKMSDVYRYVLQQRDFTTISLKKELGFIEDFMYLHQIRMGESLQLKTDIVPQHYNLHIPPMTLQVLIENAIKHNRASTKNPLQILIKSNDDQTLSIINNVNPKTTSYSTGTGLKNITQRYKLLTSDPVIIAPSNNEFTVTIPLLSVREVHY